MATSVMFRHKKDPMMDVADKDHAGNGWVWYRYTDPEDVIDWEGELARVTAHYVNYDWKLGNKE